MGLRGKGIVVLALEGQASQLRVGTRSGDERECPVCGRGVVMVIMAGQPFAYDLQDDNGWPHPHRCVASRTYDLLATQADE